jgi:type II secretion system protein G
MRRLFDYWPWGLLPLLVTVILVPIFARIVDLKITKAQQDLGAINAALGAYKSRHGDFPTESEGLSALTAGREPIVFHIPQDPWGNSYVYHYVPGANSFALYSPGIDHRDEGGGGDDVILGPKRYLCADYGVNCPPTAGEVGAWMALGLGVFFAAVGLGRAVRTGLGHGKST